MSFARRLWSLWFGFSAHVDRRAYAASGFALMSLKYATDAAQAYWGLLADRLVHAIHARVLAHVKQLAEGDPGSGG